MKLRRLTDEEYDEAEREALLGGVSLDQCPTCRSQIQTTENPDHWGRVNGTYRFRSEEFPCDCETQIALRKHYLVAGIPDQYMRLDWADYDGNIKEEIDSYVEGWQNFRQHGMGVHLWGTLGVGKTFAATHIAKEMVKHRQPVFFIPFVEMVNTYEMSKGEELEERMRNATYLVLDEIWQPKSEKQAGFYEMKLEALIRHRTNFNRPTITTTNMTEDALRDTFPRVYSLLYAKSWVLEVTGEDARQGKIAWENIEMIRNGEVRPIV